VLLPSAERRQRKTDIPVYAIGAPAVWPIISPL
jgi:hypothetical protein